MQDAYRRIQPDNYSYTYRHREKIGKTPHGKFNVLLLENQHFIESVRQSIHHTRDNTGGNIHTRMDGFLLLLSNVILTLHLKPYKND